MSFSGFANFSRDFINDFTDKVYPMEPLMRHKYKKFIWIDATEEDFQKIKRESSVKLRCWSCPQKKSHVFSGHGCIGSHNFRDTTSTTNIEWQKTVLRFIAYGCKILGDREIKNRAPNEEMIAVVTFVEKHRSQLGSEAFF